MASQYPYGEKFDSTRERKRERRSSFRLEFASRSVVTFGSRTNSCWPAFHSDAFGQRSGRFGRVRGRRNGRTNRFRCSNVGFDRTGVTGDGSSPVDAQSRPTIAVGSIQNQLRSESDRHSQTNSDRNADVQTTGHRSIS